MTPYPEYKPTGLPWLPQIPKEWETIKVRELFTERNQKVSDKDYAPLSVSKGGIVPQIATVAKTDNGDNRKQVKVGDFVINSRSDRKGSSGISAYDGSVSLINLVLKPRTSGNERYLHYLLKSISFVEEYYRNGRGIVADLWTTRYSEMRTIVLPQPSPIEQAQIVRYLDAMTAKINKLIRAKKKEIVLLQEQKQAIINRAVTKGLNPNAEMKDSGIDWIGEIPTHWGKDKIFRLFKLIGSGTTPPNGEKRFYENGMVPWINSGDLYTGRKIISSIQRNVSGYALQRCSALKIFPAGTIFVAMYGASIGNMGISAVPACCNQACCCLALPRINITLDFAFYLLQSCKKYWIEQSNGGGQPNISQEIIKQTWVGIPPESEQKSIVSFLNEKMQKKEIYILQNQKYIESLTEYKNSLISSVVTGQVDVRNIAVEDVSSDDLVWEDDTPALEDPEEEQPTAESEE